MQTDIHETEAVAEMVYAPLKNYLFFFKSFTVKCTFLQDFDFFDDDIIIVQYPPTEPFLQ